MKHNIAVLHGGKTSLEAVGNFLTSKSEENENKQEKTEDNDNRFLRYQEWFMIEELSAVRSFTRHTTNKP